MEGRKRRRCGEAPTCPSFIVRAICLRTLHMLDNKQAVFGQPLPFVRSCQLLSPPVEIARRPVRVSHAVVRVAVLAELAVVFVLRSRVFCE